MNGCLISLEGGEGAGKSTAMQTIQAVLVEAGIDAVYSREPGGTELGEAIRALLLDARQKGMAAETELLLMFASRAQLVRELVKPALARGQWVVSDRFTDASFAYQGGGRGLDSGLIAELERWAVNLKPDLTLLLDVDVEQGLARMRGRGEPDRIESEANEFFARVRAAYRSRAAAEPARIRLVDAAAPAEAVQLAIRDELQRFIAGRVS
jgi:dTMP kinase